MVETMTEEEWLEQLVNLYVEEEEREGYTWEQLVAIALDRDDEAAAQMKLDFLELEGIDA